MSQVSHLLGVGHDIMTIATNLEAVTAIGVVRYDYRRGEEKLE
jgi:hypothetical protein